MKLSLIKKKVAITVICFPLIFSSCSAKPAVAKKYGADADYFFGMQAKQSGNKSRAKKLFAKTLKKGTYHCARKSAQELTALGTVEERKKASLKLIQFFDDSESKILALKQLFELKEYNKIIQFTDNVDFSTAANEIIDIRLKALYLVNAPNFNQCVFEWFTCRSISQIHYDFYNNFLPHPDFDSSSVKVSVEEFVLNYRIKAYLRDYLDCVRNSPVILNYLENNLIKPYPQLFSDFGKAYLYGSIHHLENAENFEIYAKQWKNTELEFYFWFYAGRLHQKAYSSNNKIKLCFMNAVNAAQNANQKDNVIWYILDSSTKADLSSVADLLSVYAKQWNDPEYFEDYFEGLAVELLGNKRWDDFYTVYSLVDGYASDETVGQYAYIYGRLLEEGYGNCPQEIKEARIKQAFTRALKSGSAAYYRILAAYRLGIKGEELQNVLCQGRNSGKKSNESKKNQKGLNPAEILLLGYADFGFPELIYENYLELQKEGISTESSIHLAECLRNYGKKNHEYLTQSLRITSRTVNYGSRDCTPDELKFFYPENYLDYIKSSCNKYGIDEAVMLALIRSESFFAPEVKSFAGAIGLCQLMETTAEEIARKLGVKEYNLTDPEINIEFGTFYLAELYRRCNKSYLQAFLSYNAGINRVRRWATNGLPADLFLETVPLTETRGYGRKLISATAMYEWLYSDNDDVFHKKIEELLN